MLFTATKNTCYCNNKKHNCEIVCASCIILFPYERQYVSKEKETAIRINNFCYINYSKSRAKNCQEQQSRFIQSQESL